MKRSFILALVLTVAVCGALSFSFTAAAAPVSPLAGSAAAVATPALLQSSIVPVVVAQTAPTSANQQQSSSSSSYRIRGKSIKGLLAIGALILCGVGAVVKRLLY
jgi:hypothetical protein